MNGFLIVSGQWVEQFGKEGRGNGVRGVDARIHGHNDGDKSRLHTCKSTA